MATAMGGEGGRGAGEAGEERPADHGSRGREGTGQAPRPGPSACWLGERGRIKSSRVVFSTEMRERHCGMSVVF